MPYPFEFRAVGEEEGARAAADGAQGAGAGAAAEAASGAPGAAQVRWVGLAAGCASQAARGRATSS